MTMNKKLGYSAILFLLCFSGAMFAANLYSIDTNGDVNRDGASNIFDLLTLLKQISGMEPATEYSDLDGSGGTDIFDLLELLNLLAEHSEPLEPLEVLVTVGRNLLTTPIVNSLSQFNGTNEVRDRYHIYSNREISRVKFIFDGEILTDTLGFTPVFFRAGPDTVQRTSILDYFTNSEPITWKVTIWDKVGNTASDLGTSQFSVVYPEISIDGPSVQVWDAIEFPLVLHGPMQRFGIKANSFLAPSGVDTFFIDLNPTKEDSVVFQGIEQLAENIMEQVSADSHLWKSMNVFGETDPVLYISAAISEQTNQTVNRLVIYIDALNPDVKPVILDGNIQVLTDIGFTGWKQNIPGWTRNSNFSFDKTVRDKYENN